MKKYQVRFQPLGLVLFLVIMLPNILFFAFPAPNDILRRKSMTPMLDAFASVCQVFMVAVLCLLHTPDCKKKGFTPFIGASVIFCILYYAGWVFYYLGVTNPAVILVLCLFPCLAFLFYAIDRKNRIAIVPLALFSVCHLIFGIVNFILPA